MIKLFTILMLLCISLLSSNAQDFNFKYDSTITIIKKQKDGIEHYHRDIEVVRKKDGYWVYVYRMESDTIRSLRVGLGTEGYFDKAGYKWDLYNGVVIQLFEEGTTRKSSLLTIKGNKKEE